MSTEVRRIDAPELGAWAEQMGIGFHFKPTAGWTEFLREQVDLDRTWGAFDGSGVVGTLRSFATELTVPGGSQMNASALTNVTVAPTHTRRGLLTKMIRADLAASAERGEVVGILIASEWPIYGRFGYGPAIYEAKYEIDSRSMHFLEPSEGRVELVDDGELRKIAPALYERHRLAQPGTIERLPLWWDRHLHQVDVPGEKPDESRNAVYRGPSGDAEGYVRYKPKQEWEAMLPKGSMSMDELLALTPRAYRELWRYCCGVDLLTKIEAGNRPVDEPLAFFVTDGRAVKQASRHDLIWVRVLDVPTALARRSYSVEGRLVIEVSDDLGYASGTFLLEGGPDGATCERTDAEPDLQCSVSVLGSIYMGGSSTAAIATAGLVSARSDAAVTTADAMFLTARSPWCGTWF